MRLIPELAWRFSGEAKEPLDPRLLPLLDAIASKASLAAAVVERGMSYRAAWGLLRDYERKLGAPLAKLERGRGASLAPAGERLLVAHRLAVRRLERHMPSLAIDVAPSRGRPGLGEPLRIAASHDLALAALRDSLLGTGALRLDVAFMGSLHALQQYAEGSFGLAGFHVAPKLHSESDVAAFRKLLRPRIDRLIHFVDREQGFILPRGNPARIRTFRDIARKRLRFVNRQRGSGTRVLIDRLIEREDVDATALPGFLNEEFTHAAIAATVATGAADVGFGLRAAAVERGLCFVPQAHERYYLAVRSESIATPAVQGLLGALRGPEFRRIVEKLSGYRRASSSRIWIGLPQR
jgi:molybdate transport repressor ModE-like protein